MKKTLLIILAVAVLGSLGLYLKKNDKTTTSASPTSATQSVPQNNGSQTSASYKDGTYKGNAAETQYGAIQVAVVISSGKISNVEFLQMPEDQGRSSEITNSSKPLLKQNAIDAQSSKIDFVSGATSTSYGFEESLQAALNAAQNA